MFITKLHSLPERCEFQNPKEELIRDRIVVGMLDVKCSEAMHLKSDLTLKLATKMARKSEQQHERSKIIRGGASIMINNFISKFDSEKSSNKVN